MMNRHIGQLKTFHFSVCQDTLYTLLPQNKTAVIYSALLPEIMNNDSDIFDVMKPMVTLRFPVNVENLAISASKDGIYFFPNIEFMSQSNWLTQPESDWRKHFHYFNWETLLELFPKGMTRKGNKKHLGNPKQHIPKLNHPYFPLPDGKILFWDGVWKHLTFSQGKSFLDDYIYPAFEPENKDNAKLGMPIDNIFMFPHHSIPYISKARFYLDTSGFHLQSALKQNYVDKVMVLDKNNQWRISIFDNIPVHIGENYFIYHEKIYSHPFE